MTSHLYAATYTVDDASQRARFSGHYFVLTESENEKYDINKLQSLLINNSEQWIKKTKIKMLFSSSKTWYAFTIKNNLKKSISRVVEYPNASVEYIKYFLLFQDGRVETKIQKQNYGHPANTRSNSVAALYVYHRAEIWICGLEAWWREFSERSARFDSWLCIKKFQ